jgi:hypothetical protein
MKAMLEKHNPTPIDSKFAEELGKKAQNILA